VWLLAVNRKLHGDQAATVGGVQGNEVLRAAMREAGFTQEELANALNETLITAGHEGAVSDRTVRNWLTGKSRWPRTKQRGALAGVLGRPAEELGFIPPGTTEDNPLQRRTFIAGTAATLATAATRSQARPSVGLADVQALREELSALWERDDQTGGGESLEAEAVRLKERTLGVQQNGSATQRIRGRLYALGASFTATAMWAAIDSRRLKDAQRHLESAVTLAGMSGDPQVQHQTWRYAAMLAEQRGRYTDAIAASEAAVSTGVHRSDPLYASMSHVSLALAGALAGERTRAVRALDRAQAAYERADLNAMRPASVGFYTEGELHGLTGITLMRLGQPDEAEFHAHQALAALRPEQHRNRTYYTVQLALAQLGQDDIELGMATAGSIAGLLGVDSGRVPYLLKKFTRTLNAHAPDAALTREWNDRLRMIRSA
jgi:transcriptional regulator with XRE-family HTH domain